MAAAFFCHGQETSAREAFSQLGWGANAYLEKPLTLWIFGPMSTPS